MKKSRRSRGNGGVPHAAGEDVANLRKAEATLRYMNERLRAQAEHLGAANEALHLHQGELEAANANLREQEQELGSQAEALRESEERYRTLFETAPDAIVVFRDGRFLHANEAALRLLGAANFEDLASHGVLDFFVPFEREQAVEWIRQATTGHRPPMWDATWLRLGGQRLAVEFHAAHVDWEGVPAVQAIVQDITKRKRAEAALRELNATLESRVAQRTAELEHRTRQLQELTLELSRAEERERRRMAVILHENLLQQVAGAKLQLNLLGNRAGDDPSRQVTVAEVNRILGNVIGMSRDLSHELSPAIFCRNDLAEAIEWLADHMKADHSLTVCVDAGGCLTLESESLTVFLFRVARELLSNVVRHAGVREAGVRLRRMGRCIGLCVSDRGCGFDLQSLQNTTGCSLLGIREQAQLLGGRMTIKTTLGKGSKFRVIIPMP